MGMLLLQRLRRDPSPYDLDEGVVVESHTYIECVGFDTSHRNRLQPPRTRRNERFLPIGQIGLCYRRSGSADAVIKPENASNDCNVEADQFESW